LNNKLIVCCAAGSKETGMAPATAILDLASGAIKVIRQVGGEDEVWYNPGARQYYTASRDMPGGAVLGIIDAEKESWIENVPTSPNAKSVAADSKTNSIFVPMTPSSICYNGCIGVFEARE